MGSPSPPSTRPDMVTGRETFRINSARVVISDWKHDYNQHHRFLGLAELLCDVA
jgi:hypothetical protein